MLEVKAKRNLNVLAEQAARCVLEKGINAREDIICVN